MGRWQKSQQLELPWGRRSRGEACGLSSEGTERPMATSELERPAIPERIMEDIGTPGNLKKALQAVMANKGGPGIDGMTVDALPDYVWTHWDSLREELLQGEYEPRPVKRGEIPSPGGGVRT